MALTYHLFEFLFCWLPPSLAFSCLQTEEIPVVDVPVIEWWDAPLLLKSSYGQNDEDLGLNESRITNLIEHPVPLEPPCEGPPAGPIPLMLTRKVSTSNICLLICLFWRVAIFSSVFSFQSTFL